MVTTVNGASLYETSRSPASPAGGHLALSRREREVLALVAEGASNAEIGKMLSISRFTTGTHLKHIYQKLGVQSRAAAVRQGVRQGVIEVN